MKEITIVFQDEDVIHAHGELLLDASENSLIIQGQQGAYLNVYWPSVRYYAVSPIEEDPAGG